VIATGAALARRRTTDLVAPAATESLASPVGASSRAVDSPTAAVATTPIEPPAAAPPVAEADSVVPPSPSALPRVRTAGAPRDRGTSHHARVTTRPPRPVPDPLGVARDYVLDPDGDRL
jgi:hypothetical protein